MQMGEASWLDLIGTLGAKYLDYRTSSTQAKEAAKIAAAQYSSPYSIPGGTAPGIPAIPTTGNTALFLGLGGAALIAFMLLGDKK